jgi:hypothetical protein
MVGKDTLVAQIKEMQRQQEGAKEQWWAYCDSNGKGKRDPMKHDQAFLANFMSAYNSGIRYEEKIDSELVSQVKTIQRDGGKQQWWAYCDESGGGVRDPAKHDDSFLLTFITSYSSGVKFAENLQGGSSNTDSLAELIKEGQKGSDDFKQAWWNYCAENGSGKNDPSKYDKKFIIGFLDFLGKAAGFQKVMGTLGPMLSGAGAGGGMYGAFASKGKGLGAGPYSKGKQSLGKQSTGLNQIDSYPKNRKVWVGNLPAGITQNQLKEHFSMAGTVVATALTKRGTAGVAYTNPQEVSHAIEILNQSPLMGHTIEVDVYN